MPSAQTYTYCLSDRSRCDHVACSSCHVVSKRVTDVADKPLQFGPSNACNASVNPPVLMPLRYSHGISSSIDFALRRYGGRIDDLNRSR